MEMEVTFLPGLEGLGERLLSKKWAEQAKKGETVWEAYMRRKRWVGRVVLGGAARLLWRAAVGLVLATLSCGMRVPRCAACLPCLHC